MTHRDLAWRGTGVALLAIATAIGLGDRFDGGAALLGLGVALAGLVLIVQGKRVPAAWRVELSRHRTLAQAIRARRHRGSGSGHR